MIQTDRLELIPLTIRQLELWVSDIAALEQELNCTYSGESTEGFLSDIIKMKIERAKADEANHIFHTFCFVLRKSDRVVLGSASFKRPPNHNKEVEIGYGLGKNFEGNGYMTEAVQAMCNWAKSQEGISFLIAETNSGNIKSENVLKRCGFILYDRQEENSWWKFPLRSDL